ncbi:hypothetical protein BDV96DRAFT_643295 [Lophiotrema nucula]|uniref:NAD(P)-binding protein n=1 Tax=Lophiotrema nucula TaxID=690887 RepID=A0A6A5ZJ34_9PLEO|nr:hypothetical protein BDV96DRAFT_643295 [Lophiotrema nucula]
MQDDYAEIQKANKSFFSTKAPKGLTAVFVGATNGIGLGALRAFAKHTQGASPTIYIVGRSQKGLETLSSTISTLNPSATVKPVQANDLTRVKDAQTAAEQIASSADKIDLLIMSPGYLALHYTENGEGLDKVQAIRFYSRMRFVVTLAPLLRKAESPRVVTVLGAGTEGKLFPEDWTLKDHYSLPAAAGSAGSMVTLYLEELAKQPGNEKISFIHSFPGIVGGTGIKIEGLPSWAQVVVDWIALPAMNLFGATVDEAGERVLYIATSEQFPSKSQGEGEAGSNGQKGTGVYIVHSDSSAIPGNKVLTAHRENGMGEKVWEHTSEVFGRI